MNSKTRISAIAGAVILTFSAIVYSANRDAADPTTGPQWEYLVVSGGNSSVSSLSGDQFSSMRKQPDSSFSREAYVLERNFDKLGAKGWQLVSVHGSPQEPVYYFKRAKK